MWSDRKFYLFSCVCMYVYVKEIRLNYIVTNSSDGKIEVVSLSEYYFIEK